MTLRTGKKEKKVFIGKDKPFVLGKLIVSILIIGAR